MASQKKSPVQDLELYGQFSPGAARRLSRRFSTILDANPDAFTSMKAEHNRSGKKKSISGLDPDIERALAQHAAKAAGSSDIGSKNPKKKGAMQRKKSKDFVKIGSGAALVPNQALDDDANDEAFGARQESMLQYEEDGMSRASSMAASEYGGANDRDSPETVASIRSKASVRSALKGSSPRKKGATFDPSTKTPEAPSPRAKKGRARVMSVKNKQYVFEKEASPETRCWTMHLSWRVDFLSVSFPLWLLPDCASL